MSSGASIDIRAVIFINQDAEETYRGLPDEVRQSADARTSAMQNHQRLAPKVRKSLKGKLAGVDEIRIGLDGDAYRVYYAVEFAEVLYILHAGMKKSPRKGEIPPQVVDRLEARLKSAREDYQENRAVYQTEQWQRLARRKALRKEHAPEPH